MIRWDRKVTFILDLVPVLLLLQVYLYLFWSKGDASIRLETVDSLDSILKFH